MKSLIYACGGKPRNLDDCLDIVDKGLTAGVHLELDRETRFLDSGVITYLFGRYTWNFSEYSVTFEKTYGSYFSLQSDKAVHWEIASANNRLQRDLLRITSAKIPYQGQKRFTPKPLW
jgi:hypothetical protein